MKYSKKPLSFDAQADQLIERGLIVEKSFLIAQLKSVNYYRLSGDFDFYRDVPSENFQPNTTFDLVWQDYTFDRQLRLILMDAIERIEVSIRTLLIYYLSHQTGAFGYTNSATLPKLSKEKYSKLLARIKDEIKRSRANFATHFFKKYGDSHKHLPLWMAGEIMSFGCILTMYRGVSPSIKRKIADHYNIPDEVLTSWLPSLNDIRNVCAHHGRLWNQEIVYKVKIPSIHKNPEWHAPVVIKNNTIFTILTIAQYLLKIIAPQSNWQNRLFTLLDQYPKVSLESMGFSENWKECSIWQ